MKQLTYDDIKTVLDEMPKDSVYLNEYLMAEFSSQQPEIFDFVNNSFIFNEDELVMVLCAAEMGWHIISRILNRNLRVSGGFVYEQYCRNIELVDGSDYRDKGMMPEIIKIIHHSNEQVYLMTYLVRLLKQGLVEPGSSVRQEIFPVLIMYVKTVVDCLLLDEDKELAETRDEKYSAEGLMSVQKSVMGYLGEYIESGDFRKLTDVERAEAVNVISSFSEEMYNAFLMHPPHWNARRCVQCANDIIPDKVKAGEDFFMALDPVLMSFMDFCADRGYVPDGKIISRRLSMMI